MSSEQPKLNNSEVNNNSTSGESETAPQPNAMASSQPAPATHTTEPYESDETRSGGDVTSKYSRS